MMSQPLAEGQARMEMTAPHGVLRGKSSVSDGEGNGSVKIWQFYQKTVTVVVFIEDICVQTVQRPPYSSSLL